MSSEKISASDRLALSESPVSEKLALVRGLGFTDIANNAHNLVLSLTRSASAAVSGGLLHRVNAILSWQDPVSHDSTASERLTASYG
jgi:hypothetical protein